VLISQDDAYGMIRWNQAADGFPDFGLTFGNPDFVAYAQAYGVSGSRVESAEGLARRSKPLLPAVGSISSPYRSTIRRTCGSWSTSCAPTRQRTAHNYDRGRSGLLRHGDRLDVFVEIEILQTGGPCCSVNDIHNACRERS
jgi:hypothetical protein